MGTKMGEMSDVINIKNGYLFNLYLDKDQTKLIGAFDNILLELDKILELKKNIKLIIIANEYHEELMNLYNKIYDIL